MHEHTTHGTDVDANFDDAKVPQLGHTRTREQNDRIHVSTFRRHPTPAILHTRETFRSCTHDECSSDALRRHGVVNRGSQIIPSTHKSFTKRPCNRNPSFPGDFTAVGSSPSQRHCTQAKHQTMQAAELREAVSLPCSSQSHSFPVPNDEHYFNRKHTLPMAWEGYMSSTGPSGGIPFQMKASMELPTSHPSTSDQRPAVSGASNIPCRGQSNRHFEDKMRREPQPVRNEWD